MHILNSKINFDDFFTYLRTATTSYLLLDFDGTLASFKDDPTKVTLYPGVFERLEIITHLPATHLFIITGRGLDSLLQVLPKLSPREIWGSHGAERLWEDTKYWRLPLSPNQIKGLNTAKEICKDLVEGAFCEIKPLSVAVHFRPIKDEQVQKQVREFIEQKWKSLLESSDLVLHYFHAGIEIRPTQMSKAHLITHLLSTIPTDNLPPIAYLGDDLTDEEAFAALKDKGLKVLVRDILPQKTEADIQISAPEELLYFLDLWIQNTKAKE